MIKREDRNISRERRHLRVRKRIHGTGDRPRLNIFRSLKHIYAQVIDDDSGRTLVAASTLDPELKTRGLKTGTIEGAQAVGELIARKALEKGIRRVVFDRGGYLYHGRVAALAEAAREAGLEF